MLNIAIPERTQCQTDGHALADGTVIKIEEINTATWKGILKTHFVEGYGIKTDFIKTGTASGIKEGIKERSNIPREFLNISRADFIWSLYEVDVTNQYELVNKFIDENKTYIDECMGLYIQSGEKGTGKTMLACVIANELIEKYGITVKFVTQDEYLRLMKSADLEENNKAKAIRNAKILILDDVGASPCKTSWQQGTMFNLIDERIKKRYLTIYTSNLLPSELVLDERGRCGDRIGANTYGIILPDVPIRKSKGIEKREKLNTGYSRTRDNT